MDIKLEKKPWYIRYRYYLAGGAAFLAFLIYVVVLSLGPSKLRIEQDNIQIAEVKNGKFMEYVDVEGLIQPILTIKVNAREAGSVERIIGEEGSLLRHGDTILVLENPDLLRSIEDQRDDWEKQLITYREKEIEMVLKDECATCHGTGAKPGTSPETCTKCGGKGKVVFTQQSFFGTVQNVQTCPDCNGTGKVVKDKCPDCRGTGYIARKRKIQVTIPAGIDNGQSVRIREKGEPGVNGGPRGDLLVEVVVSRHPIFQRQDMNIYSTAPVTFAQAALGGEIRINTVDGDVLYEVKPGTQTDTKIRLKGKGVPSLRNKGVRGDQYVTLVVQTPTGLNNEAKEALRHFDELTGASLNRSNAGGNGTQEKGKKKKGFMDKLKESFDDI